MITRWLCAHGFHSWECIEWAWEKRLWRCRKCQHEEYVVGDVAT
jgi:hypothetical protein